MTSHVPCASPDTAISPAIFFTIRPKVLTPPASGVPFSTILLYPNPATSLITVDSLRAEEGWTTLDVVDIDGKSKISGIRIDHQTHVSVSLGSLPKGVYYIRVSGKLGSYYVQLLKL